MKLRYLFIALSGLLVLTACSSDEQTEQPQQGSLPILLNSVVDAATTRAGSAIQSTMLDEGEQVNVYITAVGGGATYAPIVYNINDNGEMTPVGNIYPYFPTNNNSVSIYALYPVAATRDIHSFNVQTNQDRQAQYKQSDLMFGQLVDGSGQPRSVAPTTDKQTIVFKHKLSKITVKLISGLNAPPVSNASILLCGIFTHVNFIPATGTVGVTSGEEQYITVTNKTVVAGANTYSNPVSAIVPPQTIGTGYFMKIRLSTGDVVYYSPVQTLELESGKEYKFNVTINMNTLDVSYTVNDWLDTQDPDSGDPTNVWTTQTDF